MHTNEKKIISVGVIGWGFMGSMHTYALKTIPLLYPGMNFEIRLKCVCSRRIEKAREAMASCGFETCTDDYRELLAMEDIDVVSICTPNDLHEEMAVAALKAGKHVYLDKPVAVTGESAMRIAEAAKNAPGKVRVVFNNRFFPSTMRAKQLIDEGRLGGIMHFEARYLHSGSIERNKPIGWKQQMQTGTLLDMGSHALDLVTWLIGYPERVLCKTRVLYPERPTKDGGVEHNLADDHVMMLLQMPGGALGMVEASKIATGTNDELLLEICGEKGALRWNLMDPSYLEFYDATAPGKPFGGERGFTRIETVGRYEAPGGSFLPPKAAVGWDRGHVHCYYDFLNAVANDLPVSCDIFEGARLQCLMDTLLKSDKEGAWAEVGL